MENVDQYHEVATIKYKDTAMRVAEEAMKKIDTLIVSISGAGIYVCLELIKYIKANDPCIDFSLVKITGILFTISVILNFACLWASYYCGIYEVKRIDLIKIDPDNEKIKKYDFRSNFCDTLIRILNTLSICLMTAGLILLSYFISQKF